VRTLRCKIALGTEISVIDTRILIIFMMDSLSREQGLKIDPPAVKVMAPAPFLDHDEREKGRPPVPATIEDSKISRPVPITTSINFRSDSSLNDKSCLKREGNRPLSVQAGVVDTTPSGAALSP